MQSVRVYYVYVEHILQKTSIIYFLCFKNKGKQLYGVILYFSVFVIRETIIIYLKE